MSEIWLVSHLLLWIVVVVEGLILLALMRQVGSLLLRVGPSHPVDADFGPRIGESAPWLSDGGANEHSSEEDLTLLVFVSSSCGACDELVPAINAVATDYGDRVSVIVTGRESERELEPWARNNRLSIPIQSSPRALEEYAIGGTPYAFVVDATGRVAARGGVNHIEHLEALIRSCWQRQVPDEDEGAELVDVGGEDRGSHAENERL